MKKLNSSLSIHIPNDILALIWKLLPVKSLMRFRCVSKWSKELIDSRSFVQDHLSVKKHRRFILDVSQPEFVVLDPQTLPVVETLPAPLQIDGKPKQFHLIGTLHGIVCLYDYEDHIILWNPSIHKLFVVPHEYYDWTDPDPDDPFGASMSAFWIDPSNTNAYKVIIIEWWLNTKINHANFYSSIKQGWFEITQGKLMENLMDYCPQYECPAVVIGNVAYWRCYRFDGNENMFVFVISFDFDLETFGDFIQAPSILDADNSFYPVISICHGDLSLVYYDGNTCDIYSRQQGSWVNMLSIELPSVISRVLWALEDEMGETQENCRIIAANGNELFLCDTRGGCVSLRSEIEGAFEIYLAYDFVESLLLPIPHLTAEDA